MVGKALHHLSGMRRLPLATTALGVALLAAVAGGSRILAQGAAKRQATSERDEHESDRLGPRRGWPMIGRDAANTREQPFERGIRPANAQRLAPKWVATTAGDVSATPAVVTAPCTSATLAACSGSSTPTPAR